MTVNHIKANAIEYTLAAPHRTLIHVCNDKGVMGSGIALGVRHNIPEAYAAYIASDNLIGTLTYDSDLTCINMVAQEGYRGWGGERRTKRYLNYGALGRCLHVIGHWVCVDLNDLDKTEIVLPYKMGADRAGGDWEIVYEMVTFILGGEFDITVCELP